jgi:hypothetical protein
VPLQKAVDSKDCSCDKWGTAVTSYTDEAEYVFAVLFIAEAWRLITPTALKNYFVKCGFPIDHVSSNNDSAV